jgi:hypothetical protein
MTAPVLGSGAWPPWMARVPIPQRDASAVASRWFLLLLLTLYFSGRFYPRAARRPASLHPPAQPVEQVDAGDQSEETRSIHDDGDVPTIEHRQQ